MCSKGEGGRGRRLVTEDVYRAVGFVDLGSVRRVWIPVLFF